MPKSVRVDAARDVGGNIDLPHLPQTVEDLADVIGLGRDGDGLKQGEMAHAAGGVEELIEGLDLFGAEIGDQGVGGLLARAGRDSGARLNRTSSWAVCMTDALPVSYFRKRSDQALGPRSTSLLQNHWHAGGARTSSASVARSEYPSAGTCVGG